MYVCTLVHVSAAGGRVLCCVFLEAVASMLIFLLRGISPPSCCVCVCLCEAGVQMVSVQLASGGFGAFAFVLITPMCAPVKETVNWHTNMWV